MKPAIEEGRRFLRYGMVGVISNLMLYGLFVSLVWFGTGPVFTAGLCYVLGVALSYLLNRRFTFASTARHGHDLPKFLLAYGIGFVATLIFIAALVRVLRPEVAQIVNIGLTAVVIYASLRLMRFGQNRGTHAARDQRS
jgi:putative flippase GtrA